MYCPNCRAEYVEGITQCPDCGESLVDDLPPVEKHKEFQTLRIATVLALIAICYNFAVRTLSTFAQELFRIAAVAGLAQIGFLISSLFLAFFFISFFREHDAENWSRLRRATGWAITAAIIMVLIDFKNTLAVFNIYGSPNINELLISSHLPDVIFPWLASLFILYFFVIFYKEVANRNLAVLRKATMAAVMGSLIGAMYMTFVLWNYIISTDPRWFYKFSTTMILIFLPLVTISFILNLYFYIKFYRCLSTDSISTAP